MTIYETGVGAIKMWLKNGMKPASNIEFTAGELRNLAWEIEQAKAAWIEAARTELKEIIVKQQCGKDCCYDNHYGRISTEQIDSVFGCDSENEGDVSIKETPLIALHSKAQEPRKIYGLETVQTVRGMVGAESRVNSQGIRVSNSGATPDQSTNSYSKEQVRIYCVKHGVRHKSFPKSASCVSKKQVHEEICDCRIND